MSQVLDKVQSASLQSNLPDFNPGDTIRVHVRLREGEGEKAKERIQPFEGVVISRRGRLASASFTVRRVSYGIGIERIFPLHSPTINQIEVVRRGRVRRAKLYYLRELRGKAARIRSGDRYEKPKKNDNPANAEE
jgi:large subunit ribosomal protein L19